MLLACIDDYENHYTFKGWKNFDIMRLFRVVDRTRHISVNLCFDGEIDNRIVDRNCRI